MKQKGAKKNLKLSYWLWLIWFVLFSAFIVILYLFHIISMQNLKKQTVEHMQQILIMHTSMLDSSLSGLETYLNQSFSNSAEIVRHETAGRNLTAGNLSREEWAAIDTDINQSRYEIAVTMRSILGWNNSIDSLFFCAPTSFDTRVLAAGTSNRSYTDSIILNREIENYLLEQLDKGEFPSRDYMIQAIEERYYIIRFYKVRNSYFGICMNADTVLESFTELVESDESVAFIADLQGNIMASTNAVVAQVDISDGDKSVQSEDGTYLTMYQLSDKGDFYIGLMTREAVIAGQLSFFRTLILIFVIGMFISFPVVMWLLSKTIYRPVQSLAEGMKKLGEGDFETSVSIRTRIDEYKMLEYTFNNMVEEIRELKINVFDRELDAKKFQLQCLQLQINPHFYLNTYNVIYSLAEVKDYELIQKITMGLVAYSRYMFKEASRMVSFKEELEHVYYYIELQKMRLFNNIDYEEDVSIEAEEAMIPPFIIQTFIENSCKYAIDKDACNRLSVTGQIVERNDDVYIEIVVKDNGPGYSAAVLEMFKDSDHVIKDPEINIGIYNALQRVRMHFGEQAGIYLYNDSGAVSVILIPLILPDEEQEV